MNSQVSNELISVYFDGEASPEERAAVERLLINSEDAQRELSETAKLSALLHSFPRESAPATLAGNVLRQTEQMTPPVRSVTVATAAPGRSAWRDWKAGMVGAAISATAMGLVIALSGPAVEHAGMPVAMQDRAKGDSAAPAEPLGKMMHAPMVAMDDHVRVLSEDSKKWSAATEELEAKSKAGGNPGSGEQQPLLTAASRGPEASALKAPVPPKTESRDAGFAAPLAAAEPAPSEVQSVMLNELGQTNDEFLKSVSKGEVVALMPQVADPNSNVAVVYFEVVDIDRGAEQIQLLLKKNSITPRSYKKDSETTPNDLVVIYLEAPGDKIANTLKDVELHRDLLPNWTPQAPLQFAANADEATQLTRKKESVNRTPSDKQADAKEVGSNPDSDMPDVEIALKALADRNAYQNNPIAANSAVPDANAQNGNNRDGIEKLQQQQVTNSIRGMGRNEFYSRSGNMPGNGGQLRELARVEPGYDFVRMNNSTTLGNSYTSNGFNLAQSNTTPLNPVRADSQRRSMTTYGAGKPASGETTNRALRMLFVLHPQSDGTQIPGAAAPVPAKPE